MLSRHLRRSYHSSALRPLKTYRASLLRRTGVPVVRRRFFNSNHNRSAFEGFWLGVKRDFHDLGWWLTTKWYQIPQRGRQVILFFGGVWFLVTFGGFLAVMIFYIMLAFAVVYFVRALRGRPRNRSGGPGGSYTPWQWRNSNSQFRPPSFLRERYQKMKAPGYHRSPNDFGGLMTDGMASMMMNSFRVFDKLTRSVVKQQGDAFRVSKHVLRQERAAQVLREYVGDGIVFVDPHQFMSMQTGEFDGGELTFTATGSKGASYIHVKYEVVPDTSSQTLRIKEAWLESPFLFQRVEIPIDQKGFDADTDLPPDQQTVDVTDYEEGDVEGDEEGAHGEARRRWRRNMREHRRNAQQRRREHHDQWR